MSRADHGRTDPGHADPGHADPGHTDQGRGEPAALHVEGLHVDIALPHGTLHAVRNLDLSLRRGEALGIVGESGCGKSMTALALMGLLPANAQRRASVMQVGGRDLLALSEAQIAREVAGRRMAMVFQEPMNSLNPVYTIGRQLTETMTLHGGTTQAAASERALFLLDKVGLPAAKSRLHQYPHQLSGGQRQRVMIAMALMNEPDLIIADEPTTALDVTVQAQILRLLSGLQREFGMAMILITHDLGIVSRTVDRIAVMYAGELIESGSVHEVLRDPQHPYTRGLLDCVPGAKREPGRRLGSIPGLVPSLVGEIKGCAFANRCSRARDSCSREPPPLHAAAGGAHAYRCVLPADWSRNAADMHLGDLRAAASTPQSGIEKKPVLSARDVSCSFVVQRSVFAQPRRLHAVDGVSLDLMRGEVLALVGESGCGKTTLAKILLGLQKADAGQILLDGRDLADVPPLVRTRRIQPVFQDPYSSLNPRKTIGETIMRPLEIHRIGTRAEQRARAGQMMDLVQLAPRLFHSYPGQISGGQRQRVAIARALVTEPALLICDEPTSALDVSVQSQILNLLLDLRAELGLTYMIITHDLSVVEHMATRVAVMYLGQIVEVSDKERLFEARRHPYTRALLRSLLKMMPGAPVPDPSVGGGFPNPLDMPSGCRFHPRCPEAQDRCAQEMPQLGADAVRCLLYDARDPRRSADPIPA